MELIVEGRGTFLGKHQARLRVTREQKTISEVPLIHLDVVIIADSGVAISSDVVRVCSEEGIPIHFLDHLGHPTASLYSAGLTGTVLTRRAQLLAYENASGVALAKAFVTGKLENHANLLRYMDGKVAAEDRLKDLLKDPDLMRLLRDRRGAASNESPAEEREIATKE